MSSRKLRKRNPSTAMTKLRAPKAKKQKPTANDDAVATVSELRTAGVTSSVPERSRQRKKAPEQRNEDAEPEVIDMTENEDAFASGVPKKRKFPKEPEVPVVYQLSLQVMFEGEKKPLVRLAKMLKIGEFNYQDFALDESRKVADCAGRRQVDFVREKGEAVITADGNKGQNREECDVAGPEDAESEGEPLPANKKKRRTRTELLEDEARKRLAKEKNYIQDIIKQWRCEDKHCANFSNPCLVFNGERTHYPLTNSSLMTWNIECQKGDALPTSWPPKLKLPPPISKKGKGLNSSESLNSTPVGQMPTPFYNFIQYPTLVPGLSPYPASPSVPVLAPTSTPVPNQHPNTPIQSKTFEPLASSPVRDTDENADDLLLEYIAWFREKNKRIEQHITAAHIALERGLYDLEAVRKMPLASWERMGIAEGLGIRLSRYVKEFWKEKMAVKASADILLAVSENF